MNFVTSLFRFLIVSLNALQNHNWIFPATPSCMTWINWRLRVLKNCMSLMKTVDTKRKLILHIWMKDPNLLLTNIFNFFIKSKLTLWLLKIEIAIFRLVFSIPVQAFYCVSSGFGKCLAIKYVHRFYSFHNYMFIGKIENCMNAEIKLNYNATRLIVETLIQKSNKYVENRWMREGKETVCLWNEKHSKRYPFTAVVNNVISAILT